MPSARGTDLHDAWWTKTAPPVERIAGGVWSIQVPAADLPIRYTLSRYELIG